MIINDILSFATVFLLMIGSIFMVFAGAGVVRMTDAYLRLSVTSTSATLGIVCLLLASVVHFWGDIGAMSRALMTTLFMFSTVPVAAHMLGRAAKIRGEPLDEEKYVRDDSKDYFEQPSQ